MFRDKDIKTLQRVERHLKKASKIIDKIELDFIAYHKDMPEYATAVAELEARRAVKH